MTAPVVRAATDVEKASEADFEAVQEQWQTALDDLVEQWEEEVTPAAKDELLDAIEQLVEDAQTDQIGGVAVSAATVAVGTGLISTAMLALAATASDTMKEEAERQGVTGITPADVDTAWLEGRASTASTLLTNGYAASAARQAAAVAVPDAKPKTVREQVSEHLDSLADRALRDQLGAALSAAQNAGRIAVMEGADQAASYHAVEILDKSTCQPCKDIDGTKFDSLAAATDAYLTGGYVKCLGRERCRGIVVALWTEDAASSALTDKGPKMSHYRTSPLSDQLGALLREGEGILATRHDPVTSGSLNPPPREDPGFRIEHPRAALDEDGEPEPGGDVPTSKEKDRTKLYIYSEIGGWFGVWPEDVVRSLAEVKGDVELHLHSPGGDAFDGVAIYNALRSHDGKIYGSVDGMAASAASVIAMACDELEVKRGGQLMIHDAWGYTVGNQADMDKTSEFLGKISDSMAAIYAARAGGTPEEWRAAMRAESWYTDREAVEAGLADTMETAAEAAKSKWSLKAFAHAGRENAPAPAFPAGRAELGKYGTVFARTRPASRASITPDPQPLIDLDRLREYVEQASPGETPAQLFARIHAAAVRADTQTPAPSLGGPTTEGRAAMQPDPIKIREALGLAPTATEAELSEAWAKAYGSAAPASVPAPSTEPSGTPAAPAHDLSALAASAKQLGVVMIDPGQLQQMQEMASRGQAAYDQQRRDERDKYINEALRQGKIALSRKDHWEKSWDADPEGTRNMLDGLAANMVPMEADGYAGAVATSQAEATYLDMYPEDKPSKGVRR